MDSKEDCSNRACEKIPNQTKRNQIIFQKTPIKKLIFRWAKLVKTIGVFYYELKIRLDLSFQKTKIPVLELPTYWFSFRSHNHYTKEPT